MVDQKDERRFRRAEPKDAQVLHRIINIAYRTEQGWTTEASYVKDERIQLSELLAHLQHPNSNYDPIFVAEVQQETDSWMVVGCIQAEFSHDHLDMELPDKSALIGLFAVDPLYQSKGIGSFLMKEIFKVLSNDFECETAVLWVIQQRLDIQRWYERLGFSWNGKTRPFVNPDKVKLPDTYFKIYEKKLSS